LRRRWWGFAEGEKPFDLEEGIAVGALDIVDAALEAAEGGGGVGECMAEGIFLIQEESLFDGALPELGIGGGEAAKLPVAADEGIDEAALLGGAGVEALEVFGGEGLEGGRVFPTDDFGLSVHAGFQSVHRGDGLARSGARAG